MGLPCQIQFSQHNYVHLKAELKLEGELPSATIRQYQLTRHQYQEQSDCQMIFFRPNTFQNGCQCVWRGQTNQLVFKGGLQKNMILVTNIMQIKHAHYYNQPIQGSKQPGFTHIYRSSRSFDQLLVTPCPGNFSLKNILVDNFLNKYPNRKYLAKIQVDTGQEGGKTVQKRSIQDVITYKEGHDLAMRLASALIKNNFTFENKDHKLNLLGIYTKNRQQFYLTDLACILYGLTSVPLYDTLGIQNLSYCLQQSEITTCVCSQSNAKTLITLKNIASLKNLILCDQIDEETENSLKQRFNIFYFWKLIDQQPLETAISYEGIDVDPDQCFTFCYTSGTTGPPKAAMLSQKNFLSAIAGNQLVSKDNAGSTDQLVSLSFLPLPHCLGRAAYLGQIYNGAFIVPGSGNILKLKQDLMLVKPTFLTGVPRLYNRFIQSLYDAFDGEEGLKKLIQTNSPIVAKIREGFGGRIRSMSSGSAPLNPKVHQIFQKLMGCPLREGYGLTENTGVAFGQNYNHTDFGNVGVAWVLLRPSLQFKLTDIPEMGYTSEDKDSEGNPMPRGEIWLRGAGIFLGYYKSPQLTKEALTQDGWLRTGDVGALTYGNNFLKIIDRRKNIFKLSQGEYVASEKVQNIYLKSRYVTQVFVHGDSLQYFAVCIVSGNKNQIEKLGKQLGIQKSYYQLCQDKKIIIHILEDLIKKGKEAKLTGFEQPKNLRIQPEMFTIRGIVSTTMKLQRFEARKYYKKLIDQMYEEGPQIQNAS